MVDTWARPKGEMQERSEWTTDCSSIRWSRLMTIMGSIAISQAGGQTGPSSGRSIRWFWVAGWTCIMLASCSRPSLHTSGISGDTLFSTPLLNDIWLSNLYANWECYSSRLDSDLFFHVWSIAISCVVPLWECEWIKILTGRNSFIIMSI